MLFPLFLCVLAALASANLLPLNERLASVRAVESQRCLPLTISAFLNASVIVLAGSSVQSVDELGDLAYTRLLSRLVAHMTQSMAAGIAFCDAFARASGGLVVEWTVDRVPAPEASYRTHCEHILGAAEDSAPLIRKGIPAHENALYRCLRVAMLLPAPSDVFNKRSTAASRAEYRKRRFIGAKRTLS